MKDAILMCELRRGAKAMIDRNFGSAYKKHPQLDRRQVFGFGQKLKDHSDIILAVLAFALI
jgi:hypothetical protein